MFNLGDFSSVFEISIAVHLAYGLLTNVHNLPINVFNDSQKAFSELVNKNHANGIINDSEKKTIETDLTWNLLTVWLRIDPFKKWITRFVWVSISIAGYSLFWLLYSGFHPKQEVPPLIMTTILCVALLPMPLFMSTTYFFTRSKLSPLKRNFTELYFRYNELLKKKVHTK